MYDTHMRRVNKAQICNVVHKYLGRYICLFMVRNAIEINHSSRLHIQFLTISYLYIDEYFMNDGKSLNRDHVLNRGWISNWSLTTRWTKSDRSGRLIRRSSTLHALAIEAIYALPTAFSVCRRAKSYSLKMLVYMCIWKINLDFIWLLACADVI